MTALRIALTLGLWAAAASPATAGPPGARILPTAGAPQGRAVPLGSTLATGPQERLSAVTPGGCLLRLEPQTRVRLDPAAPGTRCPALRLERGRLGLVATRAARPATVITLGARTVRWHHGTGLLRREGRVQGVCLRQGQADVTGVGAAPPPTPPTAKTPPVPRLRPGRCLFMGSGRATESAFGEAAARPVLRSSYGWRTPTLPLHIDLAAEVARIRARALSGAERGSEIEGGGQSMCLETGGESGAADLGGSGGVDIVKPPPPTRLRLHIDLHRSPR